MNSELRTVAMDTGSNINPKAALLTKQKALEIADILPYASLICTISWAHDLSKVLAVDQFVHRSWTHVDETVRLDVPRHYIRPEYVEKAIGSNPIADTFVQILSVVSLDE